MATAANPVFELSTFVIKHVAIHEIPRTKRSARDLEEFTASLVQAEVPLTKQLSDFLFDRISTSLKTRAFWAIYNAPPQRDIEDDEDDDAGKASSPGRSIVPRRIKEYFADRELDRFNELSRDLARDLYMRQGGGNSAGLLVLVDGTIGSGRHIGPVVVVLKLENTQALMVSRTVNDEGQTTYDATVQAVTLPREAEVFKAALFYHYLELSKLRARVSDHQANANSWGEEIADYFLKFLGCVLENTPDRATLEYYEWIPKFVDETVAEPDRVAVMNQLLADIDSESSVIDPTQVAERLPVQYRDDYLNARRADDESLAIIQKDTSRLGDRTASLLYEFEGRIKVWGPRDAIEEHFKKEDGQWVLNASMTRLGPSGKK